jgi:preprotein translocase subunit Sec63
MERKYKGKLEFKSISPLPPYNFVNIEMKRIDFKAIEEARRILDLSQEISISEVNSAYNLLARECHPDLHPDDSLAEEKFKKLKNAHELLTKYCEHYLCSLDKSKVEETLLIHEKGY